MGKMNELSQKFNEMSTAKKSGVLLALGGALAGCAYLVYRRARKNALRVVQVDTASLDHINCDKKLVHNLYLLAMQAFENIMKDGKANERVAMTLYSLFK